MVRRLWAHTQCRLALRKWEETLQVALRLFWIGDFAAADELFAGLLRRIIPYQAIFEASTTLRTSTAYRSVSERSVSERMLAISTQIAVGRWAISYIQAQHAPLPHPPITAQTPAAQQARRFIVDVHLARADLSAQAIEAYQEYVSRDEDDPQRLARIDTLIQNALPTPAAERLLRTLYACSPEHVASGQRLCVWLINSGRLSEAYTLAEDLFRDHPTNDFCADLLAYTAEVTQDWRIACAAYSRAKNPLRSAFMAMLTEDEVLLNAAVQELPDVDLHTPLGYLCEGKLLYQRHKLRQALDAWILAVSPGTEQEQDIPLLAALRSFEEDPATALLEIRTLAGDRLPPSALIALGWLADQIKRRPRRRKKSDRAVEPEAGPALRQLLLTHTPNVTIDPGYPFLKAVAGSAILSFLADASADERPALLRWLDSPLREQVEAIDYAAEDRYQEALSFLPEDQVTPLHRRLVGTALAGSLRNHDWQTTHQLLDEWGSVLHTLVSVPDLEQRLHQELWAEGDYPLLAQELVRSLLAQNASPAVTTDQADEDDESVLHTHHNAAIVNSQMALGTHTVDGWRATIAHWAVVLSNGKYWQTWYDRRRARYGAGADTFDPTLLPERIAQQVAEFWQSGHSQETRLRCLALLSWEWQSVLAMHHVLRVARAAGIDIPLTTVRLLSPTLIRHYAPEDITPFVAALKRLKVSDDARALLRAAFSPDAEVDALVNAAHFDLALNLARARSLPTERIRQLEVAVQQQLIDELLDRGDSDGALHLATRVYQDFQEEGMGQAVLVDTVQQWTAQLIEQGHHQKAIQRLVEMQGRFPVLRPEFHPLLSTAYVAEGQRRLALGDLDNASLEFLNALQYDAGNQDARAQLSLIHHNRAVDAIETGDLDAALADATQAMRYLADPETSTLLVDIHTRRVQTDALLGRWGEAKQGVHALLAHGRHCDDVDFFTVSVSSLLATFTGMHQPDLAVALLEGAARVPHNRTILDIENALATQIVRQLGGRRV